MQLKHQASSAAGGLTSTTRCFPAEEKLLQLLKQAAPCKSIAQSLRSNAQGFRSIPDQTKIIWGIPEIRSSGQVAADSQLQKDFGAAWVRAPQPCPFPKPFLAVPPGSSSRGAFLTALHPAEVAVQTAALLRLLPLLQDLNCLKNQSRTSRTQTLLRQGAAI